MIQTLNKQNIKGIYFHILKVVNNKYDIEWGKWKAFPLRARITRLCALTIFLFTILQELSARAIMQEGIQDIQVIKK